MEIITMVDIGNVREINQDYVSYYQKDENESLVVLCDGMGGHNAGEIASQLTVEYIIEQYKQLPIFDDITQIEQWLKQIVVDVNGVVYKKSQSALEFEGMGTTVVIGLIKDKQAFISHVGDSRAYFFNDNELIQLTKDDTLVNVLVDSGTISSDEAQFHPQKNILLQAVGVSEELKVSFLNKEIEQGLILICTDGLYNSLFDSQIIDILKRDISLQDKGNELMSAAKTYGGKDNIGIALISRKGVVENESNK
ncbi:MAG: Stp1/IreP family PP2C-type Ser/Thr phosphatase [Coprobacillus sp.]